MVSNHTLFIVVETPEGVSCGGDVHHVADVLRDPLWLVGRADEPHAQTVVSQVQRGLRREGVAEGVGVHGSRFFSQPRLTSRICRCTIITTSVTQVNEKEAAMNNVFGKLLKKLRIEKGLTLRAFCQAN